MMNRIPFSPTELEPVMTQPGFRGDAGRTIFHTPITLRENLIYTLRDHQSMFLANVLDCKGYLTRLIPDNRARGAVLDGGDLFMPSPDGELDAFGVTWIFEPSVGGAMVRPGSPLLEDIEDWEEVIKFPNPNEWDWEGAAKLAGDYLSDQNFAYECIIFNGYFERLISWMDFENAAVAMIDEDAEDSIDALFTRLTDLYIGYIDNLAKHIKPQIIQLHDDWGSQMAPFMSYVVYQEKIVPHMRRFTDRAHDLGMYVDLHSCGKVETLVPLMIEAGFDWWQGQEINDKAALVKEYGDKICIQVEVPECGKDASDDEVWEAAEKWADTFIVDGKATSLSIYSKHRQNRDLMCDALYEISRKKLCGVA